MKFDFISNILFGAIGGSLLTAWSNGRKSKKDLCIKVYERWIGNPLYQERTEVLKQLKAFFDRPPALGCQWSERKVKLSELRFLSQPSHNYQPPQYLSEDFVENFILVMTFFADLNKLAKSGLIDVKLLQTLFRDTVLPWYRYVDRLEFDLIVDDEYDFVVLGVDSLRKTLTSSFPNEVSLLHMKYKLLEKKYNKLKQKT